MKRLPVLALAICAIAGCNAPRTPADAVADAPAAAVDNDTPAASHAPAPAPAADDTTTPDDNTVPVAFRGEWASDAAACTSPGHVSQLRIDADRIAFHESSGAIQSVASDGASLTIVAQLTGEGETREATYRFRLSDDGNTLTDAGSGAGMVRKRCD